MEITLDRVDHKILQTLLQNGRASFSTIAKEVNLTDVAIKKRVDRLTRRGILSSVTADLNLRALGYENPVYVQMRTDLSKHKDVVKRLKETDHIIELQHVLGEYNLLAKLIVPDLVSAEKFIERLGTLDGVLDIKTLVILSELKRTNALPAQSLQKTL